MTMRTFILLSAIPGSGKSTWSRRYASEHPNTYIVSSDQIRKEVTGSVSDFSNEPKVWETFLNRLNECGLNEDATVIADSTNILNEYRAYYANEVKGFDKKVLVLFDIPYEVCLQQDQQRTKEKVVGEAVLRKLHNEWEDVDEKTKALFDEMIVIK